MELKALKEYKSPECPTMEESKNKFLMMMVRSGKISLGVAVMCLLCNCSLANSSGFLTSIYIGELEPEIALIEDLDIPSTYGFVEVVRIVGIIMIALVALFFAVKSTKKYKDCDDIGNQERLRRNKILLKISHILRIIVFITIILMIFF